MTNKQKIKCLFGYHDYKIPHETYTHILLCKNCKRFGYCKGSNGREVRYEYNEEGNLIRWKNSDGFEVWREYDKKGNMVYRKDSDGYEIWRDKEGNVMKVKSPK